MLFRVRNHHGILPAIWRGTGDHRHVDGGQRKDVAHPTWLTCDATHLNLCTAPAACTTAGGYWNGQSCQAEAPLTCDTAHLNLCSTSTACDTAGGFWDGQHCLPEAPQACDLTHLELCRSSATCDTAGGYWDGLGCLDQVPVWCSALRRDLCTSPGSCESIGGYWDGLDCLAGPPSSCDGEHLDLCTTRSSCESQGGYWENNQCRAAMLPARLVNLSTRAHLSGGANDAFAGFILTGNGTQRMLLRGIAVDAGVNPRLKLLKQVDQTWMETGSNDEWEYDANAAAVSLLPPALQLPDNHHNDAGLLRDLGAGVYTAQLGSGGEDGKAVVGLDTVDSANLQLVNISTRARIGGGANDIFAGFIIRGSGSLAVMLRGMAVETGVDPMITLQKHNGSGWDTVAVNDEWESDRRAASIPVHPRLPDRHGNDAGMLHDLTQGTYSLQLSSKGTAGQAVVGVDVVGE